MFVRGENWMIFSVFSVYIMQIAHMICDIQGIDVWGNVRTLCFNTVFWYERKLTFVVTPICLVIFANDIKYDLSLYTCATYHLNSFYGNVIDQTSSIFKHHMLYIKRDVLKQNDSLNHGDKKTVKHIVYMWCLQEIGISCTPDMLDCLLLDALGVC